MNAKSETVIHLPKPEKIQIGRFTQIGLKILDEQPDRVLPLPFDVLKFFEERRPKFNGLGSKESHKDEELEDLVILINIPDKQPQPSTEKVVLLPGPGLVKSKLLFQNPTSSLATRWDVIYKNMLRDCRRYFFELFQNRKLSMNKKVYTQNDNLSNYVAQKFASESLAVRRELEVYLSFLVYPKMVKTWDLAIYDENNNQLFGREKSKKIAKIK